MPGSPVRVLRWTPVKRAFLAGLLVVCCVAAAFELTATRRERDYLQLVDRGEAALARDDTFAAIEAFSGAIALRDDAMLGYLKRGEAYWRRHQLDAQGPESGVVGQLDPAADAAMRDARHAAELDPLAPRPLELIGDISYALLRYDRAVERYRAYVQLDDRSPRVLYKLALAHYAAGAAPAAVRALQQAIGIDDRFAEAFYLLGLCYRDMQRPRESLRALENAVRIAPALLRAREELADLLGRLGRREDRVVQLEALSELDPGPGRQVALGLAYARTGQFDRAVATLGRASEHYPDYSYTYVALGRVWLEKTQPPDRLDLMKALGALQGALGTENSSEALTLYGRALLLSDENTRAERVLQDATEKLPTDPLAFYYLASAAERTGHLDVARRALVDYRALEGDDGDPRRRATQVLHIADLSMRAGDAPGAVAWYQRAIEAGGATPSMLVHLSQAQAKTGEIAAARATLARALELDPTSAEAQSLQRRLQ
jgi:tetratricopeptide (TPR) repeat protein